MTTDQILACLLLEGETEVTLVDLPAGGGLDLINQIRESHLHEVGPVAAISIAACEPEAELAPVVA